MTIYVTPIPRLIELAAPSFTLGTANAAGSAITSIASDSTLLAFDTTVPTTIAYSATAAAGSSTVAARRSHTHGMVAAPATFDSTVPTTIAYGATPAAGSSGVPAQRDHTHGMAASTVTVTARETYERTTASGSGDQALTGAGFAPTWCLIACVVNGTAYWSWGAIDAAGDMILQYARSTTDHLRATNKCCALGDGTDDMTAVWKSWDADGVTITWTKASSGQTTDFVVLFGK